MSKKVFSVIEGRLVFQNGKDCGAIYQEVDGYYVWWPTENSGCWEDWSLIAIGELLREMNKPWDDEIKAYFEREQDGESSHLG